MTRRRNSRRVSRYSPHASSDGISGATRSPSRSPSPEKPASHGFLSEAYQRRFCRGKKGYRGGGGSRGGRGSSGAVGGSSGGERVGGAARGSGGGGRGSDGGGRGPDGGRGRGSDGGRGRGSDGGGRGPNGGRGRGSGGSDGGGRGAIQNSPSTPPSNRWGNSPFSIFANQLQFQRNKEKKERAGRPVHPPQQHFRRSRNDRKINPRDISKILKRFTEDDSSGSEQHDPDEGGIASTLFSLKNIPVRTEEEIDSVARLRKKYRYPGRVEICFGKGSHQYERLRAHAFENDVPVRRLQ